MQGLSVFREGIDTSGYGDLKQQEHHADHHQGFEGIAEQDEHGLVHQVMIDLTQAGDNDDGADVALVVFVVSDEIELVSE